MGRGYTNYTNYTRVMRQRNPVRLTVEGINLRLEYYNIVKEECEKFRQRLLDRFDGVEFEFPEEIFTSIETEQTVRGEDDYGR